MSKIRDKILRGEKPVGTLHDLAEWLCESIESWSEEEKRILRDELQQRARVTNQEKPLLLSPEDEDFLIACGISTIDNSWDSILKRKRNGA